MRCAPEAPPAPPPFLLPIAALTMASLWGSPSLGTLWKSRTSGLPSRSTSSPSALSSQRVVARVSASITCVAAPGIRHGNPSAGIAAPISGQGSGARMRR